MNKKDELVNLARENSRLSSADREILESSIKEWIDTGVASGIYRMSLFTSNFTEHIQNGYEYICSTDEPLYYIGRSTLRKSPDNRSMGSLVPCFIDSNKKILPFSNSYFDNLSEFVRNLSHFEYIRNLEVAENYIDLSLIPALAIQTWHMTYGHFHDEVFSLAHMANALHEEVHVLLDYATDNRIFKRFITSDSYKQLDRLLFGPISVNSYSHNFLPLKLGKLYLVKNGYNTKAFHAFPVQISDKVHCSAEESSCHDACIESLLEGTKQRSLFLTRSADIVRMRSIANLNELEQRMRQAGVPSLNPELISIKQLAHSIHVSSILIMFWGSGLTNLAYASHGTKVIAIRSHSYRDEREDIFIKIIRSRGLEFHIVDTGQTNLVDIEAVIALIGN